LSNIASTIRALLLDVLKSLQLDRTDVEIKLCVSQYPSQGDQQQFSILLRFSTAATSQREPAIHS